jgi:LPXTG-motif cell wall-anchored protein
MKTHLIAITTFVLVLALPVALYAQETDPAAVVTAVYEAFNAGDVDAVNALYADDAVVHFPDWDETYTSAEEIHLWVEELVAANFAVEVESLQVEGDTITATISAWADPSRELDIAPLVSTDVFTVKDGRIASQTSTLTEESQAKLMAAMAALPETGGAAFPTYALIMAFGDLAILGGLGLRLLRRRSDQHG